MTGWGGDGLRCKWYAHMKDTVMPVKIGGH